jgi:hypothetical protein
MQPFSRRQFLQRTAATVPAVALVPSLFFGGSMTATAADPVPAAPTRIGSQLYGWGQYYDREKKDLGAHLDERRLERMLLLYCIAPCPDHGHLLIAVLMARLHADCGSDGPFAC